MEEISTIAVLGAGTMGRGIAHVSALAGYATRLYDTDGAALERARAAIHRNLDKGVELKKVGAGEAEQAKRLLELRASLPEAVAGAGLVIEAVPEVVNLKIETFREAAVHAPQDAIFASNTSALSITEMAAASGRPQRFAGMHFFNPVPVMKLVEVVETIATSPETRETVVEFAKALGKEPIRTRDNSGFIVNRLLVPYLLDAVRALEEGVGTKEDIDRGMELGCGYPMGPLKLLDFVGLDTTYAIAEIMFDEYREKRFAPPPLLKRMVLAGRYGRKSGRGFYEYA